MRSLKIVGAALLSLFAITSANASAEQVPVSCSWSVTSSYGPPHEEWRNITRQCKESNGDLVATQTFKGFDGGGVENCSLTTEPDYGYSGDCMEPTAPSFFKNIVVEPPSSCTTIGVRVHGGCANAMPSGILTDSSVIGRCGQGCSLEVQYLGYNRACPFSGRGRSPEYGIYCK
jgi:hypothetical protein